MRAPIVTQDDMGFETHFRCMVEETRYRRSGVRTFRFTHSSSSALTPNGLSVQVGPPENIPALPVYVVPSKGSEPWVGIFEGASSSFLLNGLFGCPSPEYLCVAYYGAGYLVPVNDPENWERTGAVPLLGFRRLPEVPFVMCWDFQGVWIYGSGGLAWFAEELVDDDLTFESFGPATALGSGWCAAQRRRSRVAVYADPQKLEADCKTTRPRFPEEQMGAERVSSGNLHPPRKWPRPV